MRDRLIHSRLLAIVGRPVDISHSIPLNEGRRSYTAALLDRVVADIGTLWGNGLAGRTADAPASFAPNTQIPYLNAAMTANIRMRS